MDYGKPVKIPDGRYFLKVTNNGNRVFHQVNNIAVDVPLRKDQVGSFGFTVPSKTLFENIDNELLSQAEVKKQEWFGKEISPETIKNAFQASLNSGGELSASFATVKGQVVTTFFDSQKNSIDEISGQCDFLFELAGLWFLKRSFGPIWKIVQIRQRPGAKPKTYPVEFKFTDDPEEDDDDPTDYLD